MKRPVTYFTLGLAALALSNCARHPAPVDPPSTGLNPVTVSHEAVQQQEPKLTAWGHFSKGVRGLDDPFALARDPDKADEDLYTKKQLRDQCDAMIVVLWPEASPQQKKKTCDKFMKDPEVEDLRQNINGGLDRLDTGYTVLSVVAPPVLLAENAWGVIGGIGGAVFDDVGHYVFRQNPDQEGSRLADCFGNIAKNTVALPVNVVKAGWGFVSGTGSAVASLFTSDKTAEASQKGPPIESKDLKQESVANRASLKQAAAKQAGEVPASQLSAEQKIILEAARESQRKAKPSGGPS